jgi:hypothetical protein
LKLTASTVCDGSAAMASAQAARTSSADRPRMTAMPPCPTGTASCMAWARKRTSGTASLNVDHAGGHQGRIFTQAVAGHHRRHRAAGGDPGTVGGHTGGQHDRLGVGGQVQRFLRAFGDQLAEVEPSASDASAMVCATTGLPAKPFSMPNLGLGIQKPFSILHISLIGHGMRIEQYAHAIVTAALPLRPLEL